MRHSVDCDALLAWRPASFPTSFFFFPVHDHPSCPPTGHSVGSPSICRRQTCFYDIPRPETQLKPNGRNCRSAGPRSCGCLEHGRGQRWRPGISRPWRGVSWPVRRGSSQHLIPTSTSLSSVIWAAYLSWSLGPPTHVLHPARVSVLGQHPPARPSPMGVGPNHLNIPLLG